MLLERCHPGIVAPRRIQASDMLLLLLLLSLAAIVVIIVVIVPTLCCRGLQFSTALRQCRSETNADRDSRFVVAQGGLRPAGEARVPEAALLVLRAEARLLQPRGVRGVARLVQRLARGTRQRVRRVQCGPHERRFRGASAHSGGLSIPQSVPLSLCCQFVKQRAFECVQWLRVTCHMHHGQQIICIVKRLASL